MPYIESIQIVSLEWYAQYVARVIVERHETISHGDRFPHFEGKQYRSLGTMTLIDSEDWKPNHRGVEVRPVEVGVVPIEPDGTSFIKMRFSSSLITSSRDYFARRSSRRGVALKRVAMDRDGRVLDQPAPKPEWRAPSMPKKKRKKKKR